jgi:hypothetical protein
MSAKKKKIEHIGIIGRRWRDKKMGNTYHTAEIFVNGRKVHKIPFSYGGDSMYEQNAVEWLVKNGYVAAKEYATGGFPGLWRLGQEHGFTYDSEAINVATKKDL